MIAKNGITGENLEGIYELNNGCICCTVKDDLLITLENLVTNKKDKFDYIIIETTGVANPGPLIASLWTDDDMDSIIKLDGIVTVVDSLNIKSYFENPATKVDSKLQVAYADRILLNKIDLIKTDEEVS